MCRGAGIIRPSGRARWEVGEVGVGLSEKPIAALDAFTREADAHKRCFDVVAVWRFSPWLLHFAPEEHGRHHCEVAKP